MDKLKTCKSKEGKLSSLEACHCQTNSDNEEDSLSSSLVIKQGMPTEHTSDMPAQSLASVNEEIHHSCVYPNGCHSSTWRRWLVLGSALLLSIWGINEMQSILTVESATFVQYLFLVLFGLTFSWITVAFSSSIAGFFLVLRQRREVMAMAISEMGESSSFDWFILSDTTDPDIVIAEEASFYLLRERIGKTINVYYRRRHKNTARKAGNVADFCRRWGSSYDHLLVLDADSLMEADTIIQLVDG